jgi:tol-pal system protein YbgF
MEAGGRRTRSSAALALLPLVLLAGCASTAGAPSPWSAAAEHEELERRLLALERQATHDRLEIERLQRRIAELEAAAPRPAARVPSPAARPAAAPAPASVAVPAAAASRPAGGSPPVPPPARAVPSAPEPVAAPELAPRAEPALEETAGPTPLPPLAEIEESELEESALVAAAPAPPGGGSYENGLRLLRDGQPEAAERELAAFAAAAPDSDLADNALFWIGESRWVRGDAAGALAAYREAIDRYPEGNKVPDALFKLGVAPAATGAGDSAREAWAELVRRFPDTAAAERARERLAAP